MRHLLQLLSLQRSDLEHLLDEAGRLKALPRERQPRTLANRVIGLVFEKPSLRTRVSFETGIAHLGGTSLFLPGSEVGLGWRESLADFARTMNGYVDGLVLRVFKQQTLQELARHARFPIINGLSDRAHPCQALADLLTIREQLGRIDGLTVVFVGDGNNVARSLAVGCARLGARFLLAAPPGYDFDEPFLLDWRRQLGLPLPETIHDPYQAVRGADVVYTDVWTSMGQEAEREERLQRFAAFQVNAALVSRAARHAIVLHCLPAHRGEEITDEVIDGPQSVVFRQAENRLHAQKAVLTWLYGGAGNAPT